jgi:hypothetical protein
MKVNGVDDTDGLIIILKTMPTISPLDIALSAKRRDAYWFLLVDKKLLKDMSPPFEFISFSKSEFDKPWPR